MKQLLMGDHAVSRAVGLARVDFIAAYPITPQTLIVEELSEMAARGDIHTRFVKVESEHTALAACMGASMTGVRTFTATASQGLLLMHEILHWAAGARTPIVMVNVNRAIAPPWNLWSEQTDSLAQRDTGWLQFYCENNQDVLDTTLQAFKIAERTLVPAMLVLDAFILSHTTEPVDVPEQAEADAFLPPYSPRHILDTDAPRAFGSITGADDYFELKRLRHESMRDVLAIAAEVDADFETRFGRGHGLIKPYRCEDAELVIVTSGTTSSTARAAVDALRDQGRAVGMINVRLFRPFPGELLARAIGSAPKVAVIDRNLCVGLGGIFAQELRADLYGRDVRPEVFGFVTGLGGGDITPASVSAMAGHALANTPPADNAPIWWK
jgi:pyruvate/2-oxoacid:ferredoxin oxidoreductase alpha subunit